METNQAAENLQVIRTLMERSALYRRTLAPIMLFVGIVGIAGAILGIALKLEEMRVFCGFWLCVAVVAVAGGFLIARKQALKDHEAFWSPPTKRVGQALALPLAAGMLFSLNMLVLNIGHMRWLFIFPNVLFYACALHSAGFFMVRGIKLFAWLVLGAGMVGLFVVPIVCTDPDARVDHLLMGFFFGLLHLIYGGYLYVTEKGKNAA